MKSFVKSPLNYTGGKYKLLPQIIPLFPEKIDTFIDLFGGGANVSVNVDAKSIVYNDINIQVVELLRCFKKTDTTECIKRINHLITEYELDKENKEAYHKIRNDYNKGNKDYITFYTLLCHSFSNQIRFNSKGEFNMPFGKRTFNDKMKDNFIKFNNKWRELKVIIESNDFRELDISQLSPDSFVYIDPPYLITLATYNERDSWTEKDENDLYNLCDKLHNQGIKFAVSNVTYHKGKQNDILIEWSKKYKIHNLNHTYANSSFRKNNEGSNEVLVINY